MQLEMEQVILWLVDLFLPQRPLPKQQREPIKSLKRSPKLKTNLPLISVQLFFSSRLFFLPWLVAFLMSNATLIIACTTLKLGHSGPAFFVDLLKRSRYNTPLHSPAERSLNAR